MTPTTVYWAVLEALAPAQKAFLLRLLDAPERARAARLQVALDREGFIAAHGLLRLALSAEGKGDPRAWRFSTTPSGKPELAGAGRDLELAFSLSHSRSIVACAVSRTAPIGIDVEDVTNAVLDDALLQQSCAPSERAFLERLPRDEVAPAFTRLWTIKEAVMKALGTGLALSPQRIECALDPPRVVRAGTSPEGDWRVDSVMPTERHAMALVRAARGAETAPLIILRADCLECFDRAF